MRRLDPLSQGKPRELDRKMWAGYDTLMYGVTISGSGEALTDEIYFGTAFAQPPVLSYSTVFTSEGDDNWFNQAVVPNRGAENRDLDLNDLPSHSLRINPIILDPSFEAQGHYYSAVGSGALVIPFVDRYGGTYDQHFIHEEWNRLGVTGDRHPSRDSNLWVQSTDRKEVWALSDSMRHDLGTGMRGNWSTKCTLGLSGESNWLIPVNCERDPYIFESTGTPYDLYGWQTVEIFSPGHKDYATMGGSQSVPPPYQTGWEGMAHVWSDRSCELEVLATCFHNGGGDIGEATIPDLPDYRVVEEGSASYLIEPNRWNDFAVDLPHLGNNAILPNWPPRDDSNDRVATAYWRFQYRITGGTAGQVVHVDNMYMWHAMSNALTPIMTIGVAEWIVDEKGAYIGAKLWVKAGNPLVAMPIMTEDQST